VKHSGLPVYVVLTRSSSGLPANNDDFVVHQPRTSCSILHSSVRLLTGRTRLQHLPFRTHCRHQLVPLTLVVLLNRDLKPICLRQHMSHRTVQRYRSASDLHATRVLWEFVLTLTLSVCDDLDDGGLFIGPSRTIC